MKLTRRNIILILHSIFLSLGVAVIFSFFSTTNADAQRLDDNWSLPINLSQSGGATNPSIMIDFEGRFHVIWEDVYAGFMYTHSSNGIEWSDPIIINTPFDTEYLGGQPRFIAYDDEYIQVFWKEIDTEEHEILYSSQVEISNLLNASWDPIQPLATSALDFEVDIDSDGDVHLIYVTSADTGSTPAGVHYIFQLDNQEWISSSILYQSPYFRTLEIGDSSIVDIATSTEGETTAVFATWDNRPREKVFFSKSDDGGQTWNHPVEIDQSDESNPTEIPFNIQVVASGPEVLLLWQVGQPEGACVQYYQKSSDNGTTWDEPTSMLTDIFGCPLDNEIFVADNGLILLLTTIQNQRYLLAWDGNRWSEAQIQPSLTNFTDPETFNLLTLDCQQIGVLNDQLYIVGCDSPAGGDIWMTYRMIGNVDNWFPPLSVWSSPEQIAKNDVGIFSPVMISDSDGRIHVFWRQVNQNSQNGPSNEIHYLRKENDRWSSPNEILTDQGSKTDQLSAAISDDGKMMLVWSGGDSGEILFTSSDAAQALSSLDWSDPQLLPAPHAIGANPVIIIDESGTIFVTYAIPLNEDRGIYLTSSSDGGNTWSDPNLIFDAVAAGWDMVGDVHLTQTQNGDLHVLWASNSVPGGTGLQSLYYSRSIDGGTNWSDPDEVFEGIIVWSDIIGIGEENVQIFWLEERSSNRTLLHKTSQDDGITWGTPVNISILNVEINSLSISSDPSGQAHLLQLTKDYSGNHSLQHWTWNNEKWIRNEDLDLGTDLMAPSDSMTSAITPGGDLVVIYSNIVVEKDNEDLENNIVFTARSIDLLESDQSSILHSPTPTSLPTSEPTIQSTSDPKIMQTPTFELSSINEAGSQTQGSANNPWTGFAIGGFVVVLLISTTLGVILLRARN